VLPLVPVAVVYRLLQTFYLKTSTELQRLESRARSPVFSRFSLVLTGREVIRAYGVEAAYAGDSGEALDANTTPYLLAQLASNWLGLWLNLLSALVSFLVAVLVVGDPGLVSPAWAAVALSASLELAGGLTQTVRMSAQFEAQMTSVQRIAHYARAVPQERDAEGAALASVDPTAPLPKAALAAAAALGVGPDWPARGEVEVRGLRLRYGTLAGAASGESAGGSEPQPAPAAVAVGDVEAAVPTAATAVADGVTVGEGEDTAALAVGGAHNRNPFKLGPEVLHGVNFSVHAGAKLGIVGRTGSGKSSLAVALFRLVEPCGGSVVIDGVDCAAVPLPLLRGRLSIIPQEPVLFSASLRRNVDPFGQHSDEALRAALARVRLGDRDLDMEVAEGGANLSVGERQLLCIARAFLRRSSVILFDEATASVDAATDAFLQGAIRELFASATVLTIAHRLATVADADAVLVMDAGVVAEYGPPAQLLARPGGAFRRMVDTLGPDGAADVEAIAARAAAGGSGAASAVVATAVPPPLQDSATAAAGPLGPAH